MTKRFNDPVLMDFQIVCVEINTGTDTFLIVCLSRISPWEKIDSLIDVCPNTFF